MSEDFGTDAKRAKAAWTLLRWEPPFACPVLEITAISDKIPGPPHGFTVATASGVPVMIEMSDATARELTRFMRSLFPYERVPGDFWSADGSGSHPADANMPPDPNA